MYHRNQMRKIVIILCIILLFLVLYCFNGSFKVLFSNDQQSTQVDYVPFESKFSKSINSCSINIIGLSKQRRLNFSYFNESQVGVSLKDTNITNGGCWSPYDCKSISRIAILIPFRRRQQNLNMFLLNMHPLFMKQKLSYCIYLIEPEDGIEFNRGILMNIGFVESNNDSNNTWDCHAYHDVDLIAESESTSYYCPKSPTHLLSKINKGNIHVVVPYKENFGGVTVMKKEHFQRANGYSNLFFGWGGEDDDHRQRILNANLNILSHSNDSSDGRYYMLAHELSKPNENRFRLLDNVEIRYYTDGLNSLQYQLKSVLKRPLYTKFYVYYSKEKLYSTINF